VNLVDWTASSLKKGGRECNHSPMTRLSNSMISDADGRGVEMILE
jgi:hypothetical protein